jgi:hypothetical protein
MLESAAVDSATALAATAIGVEPITEAKARAIAEVFPDSPARPIKVATPREIDLPVPEIT